MPPSSCKPNVSHQNPFLFGSASSDCGIAILLCVGTCRKSSPKDPAPQAMEYVETRKACGIPLARRADVAPARGIVSRSGSAYHVTVAAEMDMYPKLPPWVFVSPAIAGAREMGSSALMFHGTRRHPRLLR